MLVELNTGGLRLSNRYTSPPLPVQFSNLLVLSELQAHDIVNEDEVAERVAEATSQTQKSVMQFIRSMIRTGRLRRRLKALPTVEVPQSSIVATPNAIWAEGAQIALKLPLSLRMCDGKYQLIDHNGFLLIDLSAAELIAVSQFTLAIDFAKGFKKQQQVLGAHAVAEGRLNEVLSILENACLLSRIERDEKEAMLEPEKLSRGQANKANFALQNTQQDEKEALRFQQTGVRRPKVIPVWFDEGIPAALGLVFAYAKAYEDCVLDDFYDFRLSWVWDDGRLESFTSEPAIYLCSNYLWSHEKSIAVSETVKRLSPGSITIHGGPDTPKYEEDAKAYFEQYPHVDIIVRGEGEATAADTLDKLRSVIGQDEPDLSVLVDVEGISYRYRGEIFRNPDRPRIADLDTIPSPYITSLRCAVDQGF